MSNRESTIYTSNLESKLDLRPIGGYEESLDALESLLDEEYETVVEAAVEIHPRASHEVFRYSAMGSEDVTKLEADMVKDVRDRLKLNAEKDFGWIKEKLFTLGYRNFPETSKLTKLHSSPYTNHLSDDLDLPRPRFITPYGRGKQKKESDFHYSWANKFLLEDIGRQEILIK